jgi:hypothetical protein
LEDKRTIICSLVCVLLIFIFLHFKNKHSWACNFKNVVPQKQNTICKTRLQYAKCNYAFELFKAHCAATINAKNASFLTNILKCKERNCNFINNVSRI